MTDSGDIYLVEAHIQQGELSEIHEIMKFDSLDAAKAVLDADPERFKAKGHHWSGRVEYRLVYRSGAFCEPADGSKPLGYGLIGEPEPIIQRLRF